MIKILDYGMGNTASMMNMIHKLGGKAELCSRPGELDSARAIILPGAGSAAKKILKKIQSLKKIKNFSFSTINKLFNFKK